MSFGRTFGELFEIVKNNYRIFGPWETAASVLVYLIKDELFADVAFDKRYGVDTNGFLTPDAAGIADDRLRNGAILYMPIREKALDALLCETLAGRDPGKLTFVDLGCGKGRALLIASRYPFARIVGVELSASLAEIAQDNVRRYLGQARPVTPIRCRQLEVQCTSATTYDYPDGDLLVYMYRPFTGEIFTAALDQLEGFQRATGRRVTIMLCCPSEEYLLEQHQAFRKVRGVRVIEPEFNWVVYEDVAGAAPS